VSEPATEPEELDAGHPVKETEERVPESVATTSAAAKPVSPGPAISRPIGGEPAVAAGGTAGGLLHIGDKPPRAAPQPPVSPEPEAAYARTSMEGGAEARMREIAARATADDEPDGKVKKWFKNRFSRRLSRGGEKPVERETEKTEKTEKMEKREKLEKPKQERFVGGAALAEPSVNNSTRSLERPASVRDVALAGKGKEREEPTIPIEAVTQSDHCVLEDLGVGAKGGAKQADGRIQEASDDDFDESLAAPPAFPAVKEASPVRDSKFIEEI
jgi:hypothetical protein